MDQQTARSADNLLMSQMPDLWAGAREHQAIVRELAERGPFISYTETDIAGCVFCDRLDGVSKPDNHNPGCLWRRSKELYP